MARTSRKKTKPAVKSNSNKTTLDWTPSNRNYNTLKKLGKAKSLEEEIIPLNNTKDNAEDIIKLEVATGTEYEK